MLKVGANLFWQMDGLLRLSLDCMSIKDILEFIPGYKIMDKWKKIWNSRDGRSRKITLDILIKADGFD